MNMLARCAILVLLASLCFAAPAAAEGRWSLSATVGTIEIDRTTKGSGEWWADVDDRRVGWGLNAGYLVNSNLGVRLGYERASDIGAFNRCPPGATCTAIAFDEDVDFTAWHLVVLPRLPFGQGWAVYGVLGVMDWDIDRDDLLPGGSGTTFRYGAGVSWQFSGIYEASFEYETADVDYNSFRVSFGVRF